MQRAGGPDLTVREPHSPKAMPWTDLDESEGGYEVTSDGTPGCLPSWLPCISHSREL
jgi:hypothetical protein